MARFSFAIPLVRVIYFVLTGVLSSSCVLLLFLSCVFIDVLLRRNNKRMNNKQPWAVMLYWQHMTHKSCKPCQTISPSTVSNRPVMRNQAKSTLKPSRSPHSQTIMQDHMIYSRSPAAALCRT